MQFVFDHRRQLIDCLSSPLPHALTSCVDSERQGMSEKFWMALTGSWRGAKMTLTLATLVRCAGVELKWRPVKWLAEDTVGVKQ